MHRAKAFFFVCLGILCLVAAYHFGATNAKAQGDRFVVGYTYMGGGTSWVITSNGDEYYRELGSAGATFYRNIWGGPTAAQTMSMGQLKATYAK
jgi:hypothetical protein